VRTAQVAPVTAPHIMRLAKLGAYNTNHFFRVDKGFVAQAQPALACSTPRHIASNSLHGLPRLTEHATR